MENLSDFLWDWLTLGSHSNSRNRMTWNHQVKVFQFGGMSHSGMSSSCVTSEQWSSTFTVEFNFSMFAFLQQWWLSKTTLFFIPVHVCVSVCICACLSVCVQHVRRCLWRPKETVTSFGTQVTVVSCLMCVLANEPGSICKSSKCP